ncbi:MAG TPA: ATP-binding protein [Candidatus Acidoferrales bacterium]|jgi:signal transduction histidine kinase
MKLRALINRTSLAARIVVVVVGLDLLLIAVLVTLGVFAARTELLAAFDTSLQSKALSIRALVRYDEDGSSDLIFDTSGLPPSADPAHPDVFAVYLKRNLLAESPGWNGLPSETRYSNDQFARFREQGAPFRGLILHEVEILDREEDASAPVAKITVVYASSLLEVRRRVMRVGLYLSGAGLILLLPMSWLTVWAVRRSLNPLHDLAARASQITVQTWAFDVPASAPVTPELTPLTQALQTLITRLHDSFASQRQFTSDLAHELKTSVAIIKSGAQVLLQNPRSAQEYHAGVESLVTDCERLETLVERMLRLARAEQRGELGARERIGTADLLATCEAAIARISALAAAKQLQLSLEGKPHIELRADPDDLELVWVNLLDNAVRHSVPNSTVHLRLSESDRRTVSVAVEDSGEGILVDELPHVFDRFHRGTETRVTTSPRFGLGLAICKAIIEGYGGTIHLTSAPGRGTSVRVDFLTGVIIGSSDGDIPTSQS